MFIIKDWASNILNTKGRFQYTAYGQLNDVNMKTFESFEDAWAWIYENINDEAAYSDLFCRGVIKMNNYRQVLASINPTTIRHYISDQRLNTIFECKYNRQAIDFLIATNTTMTFKFSGLRQPSWGKTEVNCYTITLQNKKHTYSFDFFDSIKNTENKISLENDFYSVLACLSTYTPESFDDFCSEFGYEFKNESEYIKVKTVHLACLDELKNLKKLFTSEELEKLSDIN